MGRIRVALALSVVVLASCGWTQYGGNAGRTGSNPFDAALTTANAVQATLRWWTAPTLGSPVIGNGFVFVSQRESLAAWSIGETHCAPSFPTSCVPDWTSDTISGVDTISDPALAGGTLLTLAHGDAGSRLLAFDAGGASGCTTATPRICSTRWSADLGTGTATQLTVDGGRAYVAVTGSGPGVMSVLVFDAGGSAGCTGAVCTPIFRLQPRSTPTSPIAIGEGRAFVATPDGIDVFDAGGQHACTAGVCAPLATETVVAPGAPSVAGGNLYVATTSKLLAFDATLQGGCTSEAIPACAPIWTANVTGAGGESPVVAAGRVYVQTSAGSADSNAVKAFDAAGIEKCSARHVCSPLWTGVPALGNLFRTTLAASANVLIMASSDMPGATSNVNSHLSFFDLAGSVNCSGAPRVCSPVGTAALGPSSYALLSGRIAVANGRVAIPRSNIGITVAGLP